MLTPEDAWQRLTPHLTPLTPEHLPRRRALGRVLAAPLVARLDVPAADVSAMDGYAVAGAEIAAWPVAGTIVAGDPPGFELPPATAVRIMTGAPVPATADRVIPVEHAAEESDGRVRFSRPFEAGAHIRRRGEILRQGDPLLPAGALLTPGALSLLATHGIDELAVHRAPRVAVITTGDEVVPADQQPAPGQLRDSHTDFLLAAGQGLGLTFEPLGIARDTVESLGEKIERGLRYDVLLLTGGVSMGELDLVEKVLRRFGCKILFDAVAMQPGKPVVAAVHRVGPDGGGLVFGLPGNPASVMVAFWLFVRPALRRLLGLADGYWQGAVRGELAATVSAGGQRDRFLPAEVAFEAGKIHVRPVPPKGSHDLAAYSRGTALLRIPAGSAAKQAGDECEVLPLADWRVAEKTPVL